MMASLVPDKTPGEGRYMRRDSAVSAVARLIGAMAVRLSPGGEWATVCGYVGRGLAITRHQPDLYLELILLYSLPALTAAWLVLYGPHQILWDQLLVFALPWITVVVAPVVLMHAVHAGQAGEQVSVLEATRRAVPWLPRYCWTNLQTATVFWLPVGALVVLHDRSPLGPILPAVAWAMIIGTVAVHQHMRTVLAPYLAVHGDLGGTPAALAAWYLGGQHFWRLLGTFMLGTAPVAVPLALVYLLAEHFGPDPLHTALLAVSSQLGWVGIQTVRPMLIPALHGAYADICAEQPAWLAGSWATSQLERWHMGVLARVRL